MKRIMGHLRTLYRNTSSSYLDGAQVNKRGFRGQAAPVCLAASRGSISPTQIHCAERQGPQ